MNKAKSLQVLQAYATGLAAQSYSHKVQSKVFADQGFNKLAEKYAEHSAEEMGYVEQFIERILDLGGLPLPSMTISRPMTSSVPTPSTRKKTCTGWNSSST